MSTVDREANREHLEADLGLTDEQFELADKIELALEQRLDTDFSASQLARLVKVDTREVYPVIDWMVAHQHVTLTGRGGAWQRYAARA